MLEFLYKLLYDEKNVKQREKWFKNHESFKVHRLHQLMYGIIKYDISRCCTSDLLLQ